MQKQRLMRVGSEAGWDACRAVLARGRAANPQDAHITQVQDNDAENVHCFKSAMCTAFNYQCALGLPVHTGGGLHATRRRDPLHCPLLVRLLEHMAPPRCLYNVYGIWCGCLQAAGLLELQAGNQRDAVSLLEQAVAQEPSLRDVLNWKHVREAREEQGRGVDDE